MEIVDIVTVYGIPLLLIWLVFGLVKLRKEKINTAIMREEFAAGLTEPTSLHPVIDKSKCMGCGACVSACPEQANNPVLGLINGKAKLIAPTNCIGHGACKAACPFDAISLVFGTKKRGVDLPVVDPTFQTNMPGIFIAGELGGMGLIKNAVEQGQRAMNSIKKFLSNDHPHPLDVVIVGAGPAGFSATLRAKELGLKYITLEQESLGGTVYQFPRGKLVMTSPATLPLIGKMKFKETTKEKLLEFWRTVEEKTQPNIQYRQHVTSIAPIDGGYQVNTAKGHFKTATVLLGIGRRGTPRKLGVKGEALQKVVYNLRDPAQYANKKVLVVGGGDSALEAAVSLSETPGTQVILSYRGTVFARAKKKNQQKLKQALSARKVTLLMSTTVRKFDKAGVYIEHQGKVKYFRNDAAIICVGGILPTGFLKAIGIQIETKHGTI